MDHRPRWNTWNDTTCRRKHARKPLWPWVIKGMVPKEKYLQNFVSPNELIFRIRKEFSKFDNIKTNNASYPPPKGDKRFEQTLYWSRFMDDKHMKRCSMLAVIRDIWNKTIMRYLVGCWNKKDWPYQVLVNVWRKENSHTAGRHVTLVQPLWKTVW